MLISHRCQFIYLKTRKTGGTSVEIYFEPYCLDPKSDVRDEHHRPPSVSEWGIVGSRGFADDTWFNHMPASQVREQIGDEVWNQYYKFCVVRNPFDKVVSQFWFELTPPVREALGQADFSVIQKAFQSWTTLLRFPSDQWIYTIDETPVVDRFVRYEQMQRDLGDVCQRLDIPWQPDRLGSYKSEFRVRKEPFGDYYNSESASRVRRKYAWELEYFGYSLV